MYHVIAAAPATGTPYPELWVPPEAFAAQMKALKRAGYHGVTLSQMWDAWHGGPGLPRHPVVVSFDDGYTSQFRSAAPVLHRLGWPGVINLEVKNLHVAGGMNAREVRGLLARGWELASHTRTHPDVTTLDAAGLEREIAGSRAVLRRRFGVPVAFFCYPAGRYDAAAVAAVRAAGYHGATTTEPGVAQPGGDPYTMPRVRVQPQDTPEGLLRQIRSMGG
jgi:peptidoglycan/xylan/chitin deacetylase (PgdA/CDA1 family)